MVVLPLMVQERIWTTLCDSYISTSFSTLTPTPPFSTTSQLWGTPPAWTWWFIPLVSVMFKEVLTSLSIFRLTGNIYKCKNCCKRLEASSQVLSTTKTDVSMNFSPFVSSHSCSAWPSQRFPYSLSSEQHGDCSLYCILLWGSSHSGWKCRHKGSHG